MGLFTRRKRRRQPAGAEGEEDGLQNNNDNNNNNGQQKRPASANNLSLHHDNGRPSDRLRNVRSWIGGAAGSSELLVPGTTTTTKQRPLSVDAGLRDLTAASDADSSSPFSILKSPGHGDQDDEDTDALDDGVHVDMPSNSEDKGPVSPITSEDEQVLMDLERQESNSRLPAVVDLYKEDDEDGEEPSMPEEPSFAEVHSDEGASIDEKEMRRQLGEIESSFIPETAPGQQSNQNLGVDDTYLELGKPGRTPPPEAMIDSLARSAQADKARQEQFSTHTTPETSARRNVDEDAEEEEEDYHLVGEAGSGFEASPSSPSAAAARRTHSRQVSTTAKHQDQSLHSEDSSLDLSSSTQQESPVTERPASGSTIRPDASQLDEALLSQSDAQSDTGHVSGWNNVNMSPRSRNNKRPSYLHSRQASHHSSVSSVAMRSDFSGGSDSTLNADYALQSGGAVSNSSQSGLRSSNHLPRLPSFGSVASAFSRDSDSAPALSRGVSSTNVPTSNGGSGLDVLEERRSVSPPETPRAPGRTSTGPTDTVLAQHVQNIRVPDTVARDFRAMNRDLVDDRRPASSSGAAASVARRTLTLKEQNSKIDKLTKENFDLKLKIHFLDQALQSRSDDGVREMIEKNVQFQTDLANERKESASLRRKVRELERKVENQADAINEAQQQRYSEYERDGDDPTLQAEMHEEILYLRQQLDHSENSVTTLREDVMTKELEKRKMAEHMRSMVGSRGEDTAGMRETIEMWQDLLNAETGRRESSEEENNRLRAELQALKIETSSPAFNRRRDIVSRTSRHGYADSEAVDSEYTNGINGTASSATLVEQLKHENTELRKDLGAQTSMLTSRNRERERLQQEIEDLKLLQRKSDGARSVAGESIFERSISRAHQRPTSRGSEQTGVTGVTDAERDSWDRKEGALRDQNAELKLKYQDLERTHNQYLQYITGVEADFQAMEQELQEAAEDMQALQRERDEALQAFDEKEQEYVKLEHEAVGELDKVEKELEDCQLELQDTQKRHQKAQAKLESTTDGYRGLQSELREITQSIMNLEDEKQASLRQIETLEAQLVEAEDEIQKWEEKCKDIESKNRKLEVTQESLHSEITFLREEQEGDKLKIGELEDALSAAQQTILDEQQKVREMEEGIVEERQQRDVLENNSKEEVQKVLDDLNNENGKVKDEVRKLRRALSGKEVEASSWKQRLDEMEQLLGRALGDANGTKQTILASIEKLQRDLESTTNELDRTKMDMADKDRLLRHRDGLLESTSLESRRLSDLLDKERSARKHDLDQFERNSRGQATNMRTIAQQESRVLELETAYSQDKRKMVALESQYREQLSERNNLLMALWNRLSTLCGQEWAVKHSSINGEVPSVDVVSRNLPGFQKNVISALKTLETLLAGFKQRVRSVEKDLWKDYQTIEHNLDLRIRRMDALEKAVRDTQARLAEEAASRPTTNRQASSKNIKGSEEIAKLKSEVKVLKAELKFHRQHPSAMAAQIINQQSQSNPSGHDRRQSQSGASIKATSSPARHIVAQLFRNQSASAVETLHSPIEESDNSTNAPSLRQQTIALPASQPIQPSEQRWVHRLKELERRLKAEREARLLDRRGARQRLEEGRAENEELRLMLEHEKLRRESPMTEDLGKEGRAEGEREALGPDEWDKGGVVS